MTIAPYIESAALFCFGIVMCFLALKVHGERRIGSRHIGRSSARTVSVSAIVAVFAAMVASDVLLAHGLEVNQLHWHGSGVGGVLVSPWVAFGEVSLAMPAGVFLWTAWRGHGVQPGGENDRLVRSAIFSLENPMVIGHFDSKAIAAALRGIPDVEDVEEENDQIWAWLSTGWGQDRRLEVTWAKGGSGSSIEICLRTWPDGSGRYRVDGGRGFVLLDRIGKELQQWFREGGSEPEGRVRALLGEVTKAADERGLVTIRQDAAAALRLLDEGKVAASCDIVERVLESLRMMPRESALRALGEQKIPTYVELLRSAQTLG